MQHCCCIWVVHAKGVTPDSQALPEHRLCTVLKPLSLQGKSHLLKGVCHFWLVEPQRSLLDGQTGLQSLIGLHTRTLDIQLDSASGVGLLERNGVRVLLPDGTAGAA